jgi:hypothetical protein
MTELERALELVGSRVTVTNPLLPSATWTGYAIGASVQPTILLRDEATGERMMLPLTWARAASAEVEQESRGRECRTCGEVKSSDLHDRQKFRIIGHDFD